MLKLSTSDRNGSTANVQVTYNPRLDTWFIRDSEGRTQPSSRRQVEGLFGAALANAFQGALAGVWVEIEAAPEQPASPAEQTARALTFAMDKVLGAR